MLTGQRCREGADHEQQKAVQQAPSADLCWDGPSLGKTPSVPEQLLSLPAGHSFTRFFRVAAACCACNG